LLRFARNDRSACGASTDLTQIRCLANWLSKAWRMSSAQAGPAAEHGRQGGDKRQLHEIRSDLRAAATVAADATIHRLATGGSRNPGDRRNPATRHQIALRPSFLSMRVMLLPRSCRA
jgi:hypothetical protein